MKLLVFGMMVSLSFSAVANNFCDELRSKISDSNVLREAGCDARISISSSEFDFRTNSYFGDSTWNFHHETVTDFADIQGVEMSAIEESMRACLESNSKCVLKSTNQTENMKRRGSNGYRRYVTFEAISQPIDDLLPILTERGGLYRASDSIYNPSRRMSALDHLGTKKGALSRALNDCYEDGNDLCTYVEVINTESNHYRNGRFYVSASASVRGYKLARLIKSSTTEVDNSKRIIPTVDVLNQISVKSSAVDI